MKSGDFRDRVRFERKASYSGGYANGAPAWAEVATVAARIEPGAASSTDEKEIGGAMRVVSDAKITVRACSDLADLTTSDRIVDVRNGTVFDIRAISRTTGSPDILIVADRGATGAE